MNNLDPDAIKLRLREAADVIKRLPGVKLVNGYPTRCTPEATGDNWDTAYEAAGGYDEARGESETVMVRDTYVRPAPPQGREIEDAWEAYDWLGYLSDRDRAIVWSWAKEFDWWKIAAQVRRSESTAQRWFRLAIERIAEGLAKNKLTAITVKT